MIEFIADRSWEYYLSNDEDQENIKSLQNQLADVDKAINNLVRAIELGVINDVTVNRMQELEGQKAALTAAIADQELQQGFKIEKDYILCFLSQFKKMDYSDRDCQHRLIDIFVNSIFLYDDRLKITFNFGVDSNSTITLKELNAAENMAENGFVCCAPCPAIIKNPNLFVSSDFFILSFN